MITPEDAVKRLKEKLESMTDLERLAYLKELGFSIAPNAPASRGAASHESSSAKITRYNKSTSINDTKFQILP